MIFIFFKLIIMKFINETLIFKLFLIFAILIIIKLNDLFVQEGIFIINKNSSKKKSFHYKGNEYNNNYIDKQMINITLSLDNSHIYQTLVVMISALENNEQNKHFLVFYLLLSDDFDSGNIKIFESLKVKYQLIIYYYYIPNIFNGLKTWRNNTTAIYFKLLIPILIPNIKRIIHLDGDTLVFKDLWEIFNLPFEDNYYLGQATKIYIFEDKKMFKRPINVGVLLINIDKIRKDNKDFEIFYYLFKKRFTEQLAINYVCYPKIGYLPFKYGRVFANIHKNKKLYSSYLRMKLNKKVKKADIEEAIKDPSITHILCCKPKYWYKRNKTIDKDFYEICLKFEKLFYYYAKKTKYYKAIYKKFNTFKQ